MKFNNLIEVRDYLETIPEDKYVKESYNLPEGRCAMGWLGTVVGGVIPASSLVMKLSKDNNFVSSIMRTNDSAENPKQAVIELLNQRIFDLEN